MGHKKTYTLSINILARCKTKLRCPSILKLRKAIQRDCDSWICLGNPFPQVFPTALFPKPRAHGGLKEWSNLLRSSLCTQEKSIGTMVAMLRMITESSAIILFASLFYHLLRLVPLVFRPPSPNFLPLQQYRSPKSTGDPSANPEIDWIRLPSAHKRYGIRVAHFTAPPGDLVRIFMSC